MSGPAVVRRVEAGAGEPAVVLEAGLNNGAASWQRVMPLLAPHVRVVAYDRAGLAASAPQGRHVVVNGTGHNIPRNRPDVVADTILGGSRPGAGERGWQELTSGW